jgi:hypothetical protein
MAQAFIKIPIKGKKCLKIDFKEKLKSYDSP